MMRDSLRFGARVRVTDPRLASPARVVRGMVWVGGKAAVKKV
jgi:hypothetical protein